MQCPQIVVESCSCNAYLESYVCMCRFFAKFTGIIPIIGDVDYDSELYNVAFAKGDTSVTFCVNITDDNALEADETFSVIIDDTSLPVRAISVYPNAANVTIVDNECKYLTLLYWKLFSWCIKLLVIVKSF